MSKPLNPGKSLREKNMEIVKAACAAVFDAQNDQDSLNKTLQTLKTRYNSNKDTASEEAIMKAANEIITSKGTKFAQYMGITGAKPPRPRSPSTDSTGTKYSL